MNWFKQSQQEPPIRFLGWSIEPFDVTGNMRISFRGVDYTYQDISREEANHISFLLSRKNYRATEKKLRFYSDRYKKKQEKKELTPRGHTPQDENNMLDQLYDEGHLQ